MGSWKIQLTSSLRNLRSSYPPQKYIYIYIYKMEETRRRTKKSGQHAAGLANSLLTPCCPRSILSVLNSQRVKRAFGYKKKTHPLGATRRAHISAQFRGSGRRLLGALLCPAPLQLLREAALAGARRAGVGRTLWEPRCKAHTQRKPQMFMEKYGQPQVLSGSGFSWPKGQP